MKHCLTFEAVAHEKIQTGTFPNFCWLALLLCVNTYTLILFVLFLCQCLKVCKLKQHVEINF